MRVMLCSLSLGTGQRLRRGMNCGRGSVSSYGAVMVSAERRLRRLKEVAGQAADEV
jgi:hypothetical protein